jgi:hypothetical protein
MAAETGGGELSKSCEATTPGDIGKVPEPALVSELFHGRDGGTGKLLRALETGI